MRHHLCHHLTAAERFFISLSRWWMGQPPTSRMRAAYTEERSTRASVVRALQGPCFSEHKPWGRHGSELLRGNWQLPQQRRIERAAATSPARLYFHRRYPIVSNHSRRPHVSICRILHTSVCVSTDLDVEVECAPGIGLIAKLPQARPPTSSKRSAAAITATPAAARCGTPTRTRRHSSLGMLTPIEYEKLHAEAAGVA